MSDHIIHKAGCGWEAGPYCTCGADPERSAESDAAFEKALAETRVEYREALDRLADDGSTAECDPLDDVQDHHDWNDDRLPVCKRCGALSQIWEE